MPLASEYIVEGENGFTGMMSRGNPLELAPGFVSYAQNMRFDQGTASVRRGAKRLTAGGAIGQDIYDSGIYSDPTTGVEKVIMVGASAIFIYNTVVASTSSVSYPTGRTISATDKVACFQADNKFFILRGGPAAARVSVTITNAGATATVTQTAHGYANGDEVTITGMTDALFNGSQIITVTGANTYTYTMTGTPASTAGTPFAQKAKPALVWDGVGSITVVTQTVTTGTTANFPPADFGIYFQNRIIVKRERDKIAASDYFDYNTWDLTFNQFTINLGGNDYIVGFQPWQEDKFLIFERNSIYYAYIDPNSYTSGAPPGGGSYIKSLTSEFGCSARRSVVNAGEFIFFLSDNGVYLLNPSLDLKLLGNTTPLSDPISDIIARINANAVQNAVGRVFNNRYYLAVPLDSSTRNNAVLVYSMLNKAWESVDTFPSGMCIDNLLVAIYGSARRLYATNKEGGIFVMEELNYDEYLPTGSGVPLPFVLPATLTTSFNQNDILGQIITRRYFYQTFAGKRFSYAEMDMSMVGSDSLNVVAKAVNPDNSSQVFAFTSSTAEDYTKRFRIAKRGFGLDLEINTTSGRPTIGGLRVYAVVPGKQVISED